MSLFDIFQKMTYAYDEQVGCYNKKIDKQSKKLSTKVILLLNYLIKDLEIQGPALREWPNYGKLHGSKNDRRHCHLQKGKPTYVCCFEVVDKKRKIIEVDYVGTHEKAPY